MAGQLNEWASEESPPLGIITVINTEVGEYTYKWFNLDNITTAGGNTEFKFYWSNALLLDIVCLKLFVCDNMHVHVHKINNLYM